MAVSSFENQPYMKRIDDLSTEGALEILLNPDLERVSTMPAVLPRAGDVYVYAFSTYAKSDISKIRTDGYTWYSCSGKVVRSRMTGIKVQKYYWTVQSTNESGDHRFRRHEYRLMLEPGQQCHSFAIITHYLGDETVAVPRANAESAANGAAAIGAQKAAVKARTLLSRSQLIAASEASPAVTVEEEGRPCQIAISSADNDDEKCEPAIRLTPPRVNPILPLSMTFPINRRPIKRTLHQSPMGSQLPKKLSKNNLLGQQVEVTLDALRGDELIAARDEIYDFLRKWDKD